MTVSAMEMMVMMIPMKSSSMTVTMAMISPLRDRISPTDFSLPESFSLSGVFRLVEAVEYFLDAPLALGFLGDDVRERGLAEVGQGLLTTWRRGGKVGRATTW